MVLKKDFEIVDMVGEHMVVPLGKEVTSFNGIVALSEASAFLLKSMETGKTEDELVDILINEFNVEPTVARADISEFLNKMIEMGIIEQ